MPKISKSCSKLEGFFYKKKLISLIVRMRTNRGSTITFQEKNETNDVILDKALKEYQEY